MGLKNGASDETKCASLGFYTTWGTNQFFHYVKSSKVAFKVAGFADRIVYTFKYTGTTTISSPTTYLKAETDSGNKDNQTILVYYIKYEDLTSSKVYEQGINFKVLNIYDTKYNKYYFKFLSDKVSLAENKNFYVNDVSNPNAPQTFYNVGKTIFKK